MEKKHEKRKQYFIACIPPLPVYDDAHRLKLYFRDKYNSKASLNSPPHITLHMPFRREEKEENELARKLQQFINGFDPIKICLDNFSAFQPRVIFINVVKSETLESFHGSLCLFCKKEMNFVHADHREEVFNPHITLASRDLKKAVFREAWEEFKSKEYKAEFIADKISLLKHNGRMWEVLKDFPFRSSYSTDDKSELISTEG